MRAQRLARRGADQQSAPPSPTGLRTGHRTWSTGSSRAGPQPAARGRLHLRAAAGGGFAYTAFVIDAFAGRSSAGRSPPPPNAALVGRALADAMETRRRQGHPIQPGAVHHSDAGSPGRIQAVVATP